MGHVIQRFGFSIGPGWAILLLLGAGLTAGAFWIGPLRPLPAELELLAVAGDTATSYVTVPGVRAADGSVRFPVQVAMRNVGVRAGQPARISLSVPAHYRVFTNRGSLPSEVTSGVPLRRYTIPVAGATVVPGSATQRVPGLDTLWLAPELPSYYCILQGGTVPEFLPAPDYNAQLLSRIDIFYSFTSTASDRHTGLLTVRVDPALLETTPAAVPPSFQTQFYEPQAPTPELGTLRKDGSRTAYCGDPERSLELFTVRWVTSTGGRIYSIYTDAMPRKQLYDFNGDGIIELESWDADGDGRFEAMREARFAVPEFLVPQPEIEDARVRADTTRADSTWLARFNDTRIGPWRFTARVQTQLAAERTRLVRDSIARDSARVAAFADSAARAGDRVAQEEVPPEDPDWLRWFNNTAEGPFRFSRPIPDDTMPPPVRRPTRRVPRPLGTPVPYPRPDTLH
jgi:hypothetical protein